MPTEPRPRQVTLPCLVAIAGSVLVLTGVFATLSDWGSSEIRDQVEDALARGPAAGLDVDTDQVLSGLRIALMAVAALAVTAVVAGIYTMRGHRGARVLLTVLSALTAAGMLAGGLGGIAISLVAAACVASLWSKESRLWFRPPRVTPAAAEMPDNGSVSTPPLPPPGGWPPPPTPMPASHGQPPPPAGHWQSPVQPPAHVPGQPWGAPPPSYPYGYAGIPMSRPATITAAGVITIVAASIAALAALGVTIAYLADSSGFSRGLAEGAGVTPDQLDPDVLGAIVWGLSLFGGALAVTALVFAILLLRNSRMARIPLIVLSAITILFALLFFPAGLLWSAAAIAVLVMLASGQAPVWFEMQRHRSQL